MFANDVATCAGKDIAHKKNSQQRLLPFRDSGLNFIKIWSIRLTSDSHPKLVTNSHIGFCTHCVTVKRMAANTRFSTSVHTLVLLVAEPEVQQTSEEIAKKLNTNPVVIRRVLSLLRAAGLVTSHKGPSGGSKLAKPAKAIRLGDIYRAVESAAVLHTPKGSSESTARIDGVLEKVYRDAADAMISELDSTTLSQVAKKSDKKKK
jgi:Rrf2 family protein